MNINLASFFDFWRNQRRLNVTVGQKTVRHSQLLMNSLALCSILNLLNVQPIWCVRTLLSNICLENARISGDLNSFDRRDQRFCDRWFLELYSANADHNGRKFLINLQRFPFVSSEFAVQYTMCGCNCLFSSRFFIFDYGLSSWLRVCFVFFPTKKSIFSL